jgi:hypothetical protein
LARGFNTGRMPSGEAPSVLQVGYTTGQTFKRGALVKLDAAGTISECGADPAKIYGVALQDAGSGYGYAAANNPLLVTGQNQEISVAVCDRVTVFSCRGVNGGTDPVTPLQTHIGETYGCLKVSNDWVLDIAEVTTMQWEVIDIDVDNKVFFVKILNTFQDVP